MSQGGRTGKAGRGSIYWTLSDTWVMTKRGLLKYIRIPQMLVFSIIQPIMFMLLFAYVFGGAIETSAENYLQFLIPGILVQTIIFSSTMTGIGLAADISTGISDRFHSLPMARSALLAGRIIADSIRNFFVLLIMLGVGLLIGFRFEGTLLEAAAAIALILLMGGAFSWISAAIGLAIKDMETVQIAGFIWMFPLVFASSIFVPVQTMPGFLKAFAELSPITLLVDSVRALMLGGDPSGSLVPSLIWIAAITALFSIVAVRLYQRTR